MVLECEPIVFAPILLNDPLLTLMSGQVMVTQARLLKWDDALRIANYSKAPL